MSQATRPITTCLLLSLIFPAWTQIEMNKEMLASARQPNCGIDVSGRYLSEYHIVLTISQQHCMISVDPPGREIGMVSGRKLNIAGVQGEFDNGQIKFKNGAKWIQQSSRSQPAEQVMPLSTTTAASTGQHKSFWWNVGAGLAVASVGIMDGAVAAELAEGQAAKADAQSKVRAIETSESDAQDNGPVPKHQDNSRGVAQTADAAAPVNARSGVRFMMMKKTAEKSQDPLPHNKPDDDENLNSPQSQVLKTAEVQRPEGTLFCSVIVLGFVMLGLLVLAALGHVLGSAFSKRLASLQECQQDASDVEASSRQISLDRLHSCDSIE